MKVLTISHMYPSTFNKAYGIVAHKQAKALQDKGIGVRVVSPVPWTPFPINKVSKKWEKYNMIPEFANWDGVQAWYPRYLTFPKALFLASSGKRMYWGIRESIKNIYQEFKFDLIHAHMAFPDGYASMLLSHDYKKPYLVNIKSTDLDITVNKNDNCLKKLQRVFLNTSEIISPSPVLSNKLKCEFNVGSEIIGHGIDSKDIFNNRSSIKEEYEKYNVLLSVSQLIVTKGIDFNLYAFKKMIEKYDNLFYLIIGDGPEKPDLVMLARRLGVERSVKFLGHLEYEKVMEYMSICDIFVLPSWKETFGLAYTEAMAHGKPVIGCYGHGVDGVIADKKTGILVKPKDVDSLAEAMDFLLSNPNKAKEIGERGRKLVLDNYTWEKNAEKTIKIYQEVLSNARKS